MLGSGAGASLDCTCTVGWMPPCVSLVLTGFVSSDRSKEHSEQQPWLRDRAVTPLSMQLLLSQSSVRTALGQSSFGIVLNSPWPSGPQHLP